MTASAAPVPPPGLVPPPPRPLGVASPALPEGEPELMCATAAAHGVAGVEWGAGSGHVLAVDAGDRAVDRLVRAADGEGLECCGFAVHEPDALAWPLPVWRRLAETAVALGAPHVRAYPTPSGGEFRDDLARLRDRVAERAQTVAEAGVRLLLEPSPNTLVPGPELAREVLAGALPHQVGVVYDPGSLAREGWLDPFLATAMLGPLLRHVHVKNVSPRPGCDGAWGWQRSTLESGIVDWPRVFAALDRVGYRRWLVLDHTSSHADGSLATDLGHLRALMETPHAV
jgi:sugar phosphate isomerase/epimerase